MDPAKNILELSNGRGVDALIDAVGLKSKGLKTDTILTTIRAETSSGSILRHDIIPIRRGGHVSVPGVYAGFIQAFMFSDAFKKGLTLKMGQTHVERYLPELLQYIENGDLQPDVINSHRMKLAYAAQGDKMFSDQTDNCRQVLLSP